MWTPLQRDKRGYEGQFSTNHLGHFHLTTKLWDALKKADGARVVTVSSSAHHYSPVLLDDIRYKAGEYDKFEAYGQSKTANVLFTVELDKKAKPFGVRAYVIHPDLILQTNLGRHLVFEDFVALAATTVWAATSPQLENIGGVYLEDVEIAQYDQALDA